MHFVALPTVDNSTESHPFGDDFAEDIPFIDSLSCYDPSEYYHLLPTTEFMETTVVKTNHHRRDTKEERHTTFKEPTETNNIVYHQPNQKTSRISFDTISLPITALERPIRGRLAKFSTELSSLGDPPPLLLVLFGGLWRSKALDGVFAKPEPNKR